jgi:hypothetical protein
MVTLASLALLNQMLDSDCSQAFAQKGRDSGIVLSVLAASPLTQKSQRRCPIFLRSKGNLRRRHYCLHLSEYFHVPRAAFREENRCLWDQGRLYCFQREPEMKTVRIGSA